MCEINGGRGEVLSKPGCLLYAMVCELRVSRPCAKASYQNTSMVKLSEADILEACYIAISFVRISGCDINGNLDFAQRDTSDDSRRPMMRCRLQDSDWACTYSTVSPWRIKSTRIAEHVEEQNKKSTKIKGDGSTSVR